MEQIASLATAIAERRENATTGGATGMFAQMISDAGNFIAVRGNELLNQAGDLLQPDVLSPTANLTEAERQLLCSQSPEAGECRAAIQRWHYNPASGTCETFIYGGCGGNGNNFDSAALCVAGCRGVGAGVEASKETSTGDDGGNVAVAAAAEGEQSQGPLEVTVLPAGDVVNGDGSSSSSSSQGESTGAPQQQRQSGAGLVSGPFWGAGIFLAAACVMATL
jgi:hypothetical protein